MENLKINLSCPVNTTGYGVIGLNLLKGLYNMGCDISLWPLPDSRNIEAHVDDHQVIKKAVDNQQYYDVTAPSIRHWHQFDLAQHVGKGPRIGSTVFELNKFTDREKHHLKCQDFIVVPTEWAKKVIIDNKIHVPITIVPHGVDRKIFHENIVNENIFNETVFMNISKWEVRKSHDLIVEAFNKAFTHKDKVKLIMSCYNPFYSPEENKQWEDLYKNSNLGYKTTVLNSRLETQYDVANLMSYADCGVFPSRAEGWGLGSFEMMSMGKHVILTDYAGHTGYANNENALLISPGPLEDAYDGKWFHGQGQWASLEDEQVDQLVEHMRSIHRKKQSGELNMNTAGIEVARQLSWENTANKLIDFIKEL